MPRESLAEGRTPKDRVAHPVDRRHRILTRVAAEQTIHVAELARELRVSEMTIRRDIFDWPATRSGKTIGTSCRRKPA